jgi:hypothetical protein
VGRGARLNSARGEIDAQTVHSFAQGLQ